MPRAAAWIPHGYHVRLLDIPVDPSDELAAYPGVFEVTRCCGRHSWR
ncbi:hypothetical protein [Streptomyces sp. NPDC059649]